MMAMLFQAGAGMGAEIWVGKWTPPNGLPGQVTVRVSEVYFLDQNTVKFAIKAGLNTDEDHYVWVKQDAKAVTIGPDSEDRRAYYTISALDIGHGALMALHAQLLKAMELNKRVGFRYDSANNPARKIYDFVIYRD